MFSCKRCGYQTSVKTNIKGHLLKLNHVKLRHCDN